MSHHLADYESAPRRGAGWTALREDVHVHVSAPVVRAYLADPTGYRRWLPPAVRDVYADSEGTSFVLGLPGRQEGVSLRRSPTDDPREVVYQMDNGGVVDTLRWGLHPEGHRECHVTLEVVYRPARGFLGGALETLLHRGQRTQVLRDFLWNLKRDIEQTERAEGSAEVAGA